VLEQPRDNTRMNFQGSRERIERATTHRKVFRQTWSLFLDDAHPYELLFLRSDCERG
jgi:hypothetical protein